MLLFDGFLGIVAFGVWIFCIIDVVTQPEQGIRTFPKLVWLLVVVLLMDIGSIAWLVAGRPWGRAAQPRPTHGARSAPDDDPEFLAELQQRTDEQRRRAREIPERDDPPQNS
jgi:hypothetical protein